MKSLLLLVTLAVALLAQETRREVTNAAANPADDAKGLSAGVPDVYAVSTQFDRFVVLEMESAAGGTSRQARRMRQSSRTMRPIVPQPVVLARSS